MQPQREEITLFNAVTPTAIVSSTSATPTVITATGHGLTNGQRVLIFGHSTNTNANGIFVVSGATTNTFALVDELTGANIAGNGVGSNTGLVCAAPQVANVTGFRNAILQVGTTGTATLTLKAAGSIGLPGNVVTPRSDFPNMGATIAPTNPYSFLQLIPLDTQTALAGGTGIAQSGADVNNLFQVNITALKYLTLIPTAWTQGAITAKLFLTTNS